VIVAKRKRRLASIDDIVLSFYASGLTSDRHDIGAIWMVGARSVPVPATTHSVAKLTQDEEDKPDDQDNKTDRRQNADLQKDRQEQQNHTKHNHGAPPLRHLLPGYGRRHAAAP
jgi:hypothetical protein